MSRITYRKTRKGETIDIRADKGEDLRNVVAEMARPARKDLTAEEIRGLRASALTDGSPWDAQGYGPEQIVEDCDIALGSNGREACIDRGYSITPHMRDEARARCAEILNARAKAGAS